MKIRQPAMTHHQQLTSAIHAVEMLDYRQSEDFFTTEVYAHVKAVYDLMFFPSVNKENFRQYLGLFQNDLLLLLAMIQQFSASSNEIEALLLLGDIRLRVRDKLRAVEYAFAYYEADMNCCMKI